jgi:hypothetical protein
MQPKQKLICLLLPWLLATGMIAGCRPDDDFDGPGIDRDDLVKAQPDAEPPKVKFPAECQHEDVSLNTFVAHVLDICQRGDYDRFCNLFGISDIPPGYDDFRRIWGGVGEIAVQSLHLGSEDPPQYFVHAIVKLRRPDAQKRLQREVVVRVFKELDEWRISGAPSEVVRKVLDAATQAASAPSE